MTTFTERRLRLRTLIAGSSCIVPGSVHDALSVRIAEELGFEAVMLGGSVASLAVLGVPDLILLTLTEFAEQVHRICRATNLPLFVDADHGYGNALNVARTIEELEHAGVSGLTIEDTILPRTFGETAGGVTSIAEGVGKMKAAVAARSDPQLVIAGRTSALKLTGLEDTIERAKAYEAEGVDMMCIIGANTRAQLEAVASAIKIPLVVGGIAGEVADSDYLASQRVRIRIPSHLPIKAAVQAIHDTMIAMRNGTPAAQISNLASDELMAFASANGEYARRTVEWMGGKTG